MFRLTEQGGRDRDQLLAAERVGFDMGSLQERYKYFEAFITEFKALMSAWQVHLGGQPDDHTDDEYDGGGGDQVARS